MHEPGENLPQFPPFQRGSVNLGLRKRRGGSVDEPTQPSIHTDPFRAPTAQHDRYRWHEDPRMGENIEELQKRIDTLVDASIDKDTTFKYGVSNAELLQEATTQNPELRDLVAQRDRVLKEADQAGVFDTLREVARKILEYSDWDDVYLELDRLAKNYEVDYNYPEGHPEWKGLYTSVIQGLRGEIMTEGLRRKAEADNRIDQEWKNKKHYTSQKETNRSYKAGKISMSSLRIDAVAKAGEFLFGPTVCDDLHIGEERPEIVSPSHLPHQPPPSPVPPPVGGRPPFDYADADLPLDPIERNKRIEQLNLIRQFFSDEYIQGPGSQLPEQSLKNYIGLSIEDAKILHIRSEILRNIGLKRGGIDGYKDLKNFNFTRDDLNILMSDPCFRIVMATMTANLFEIGILNPGKHDQSVRGLVFSELGKKFMQDNDPDKPGLNPFNVYRENLTDAMVELMKRNPALVRFGFNAIDNRNRDDDLRVIAQGYVGAVWNLLGIGFAQESGDCTRKVKNNDVTALVPPWRVMFHMHDQAVSKFVKGEDMVGYEESYFGVIGNYLVERCRASAEFRSKFDNFMHGYRFIPRVLIGSLFDHTRMQNGITLAEALVNSRKEAHMMGNVKLYDYKDASDVDCRKIEKTGFAKDYYLTKLGSAVTIYTHLNSAEAPKDPIQALSSVIQEINSLRSAKNDDILNNIFDPGEIEDLIVACIGICGGGFLEGTNDLVMKQIRDVDYDDTVERLFRDPKIGVALGGLKDRDITDRLRKRLNAAPIYGWRGAWTGFRIAMSGRSIRKSIRDEASKSTRTH